MCLRMAEAPLVSIVIPVYNAGDLLRGMIDSVLGQTEKSFELLLLDDGSTDVGRTRRILEEYAQTDFRIRVIYQENIGVSKTRDKGIALSRGEWVYVCDQDDCLHPRLLEFALWACRVKNLDYLKITHEFGSVKAKKRFDDIGDFESVTIDVVDNLSSDAEAVGASINKLHTDAWAQFVRRDLAEMFPNEIYDVSRVFHIVGKARRWGISVLPLYYYHGDIESSMIHKAISPGWIDVLHGGWARVYDLYASSATDRRGKVILRSVCSGMISSQLKVIFHMIKRLNKLNPFSVKVDVWGSFGIMSLDFLFKRRLSLQMLGFKHYMEYLVIGVVFGLPKVVSRKMKSRSIGF